MSSESPFVAHTKSWIEKIIIGCNFCPFAAKPYRLNQIEYRLAGTEEVEGILEKVIESCVFLDHTVEIETLLLILPTGFEDLEKYLDLTILAEDLLLLQGYEGVYQIASFHPVYQFEDAEADDAANYTNRSPYPMLHLLREESISKALEHFEGAEEIPERNIEFARAKGMQFMKVLRDSCFQNFS
ncbi:MAG: DUF1415 domain-containing protein [Saprospiraceae bacterium]